MTCLEPARSGTALLMALVLHVFSAGDAFASTSAAPFIIRHGTGRLLLPTQSPLARDSRQIEWQDGCGHGDRICGQATVDGQLFYLMGGTVSPEEARRPHECEAGAKREEKSGACIYKKDGVFTWTKRFGRVIVAVSTSGGKLDGETLVRWLEKTRWEESK